MQSTPPNRHNRRTFATTRTGIFVLLLILCTTAFGNTDEIPSTETGPDGIVYSGPDEHGRLVYLVQFASPGMLHRPGRAPGRRFDPESPDARAHRDQLQAEQAVYIQAMSATLERPVEASHHFLVTHSGMAVRLTESEARQMRKLPGVVSVVRERMEHIHTYRGPTFIGAGAVWDGSAVPGGIEHRGGGVVIGVLDTGVDPGHPSFQDDPACGHGDTLPDKLLSFVDCASTDAGGQCNGSSPSDSNGHGSHTGSTAGGNRLDGTASPPPQPPAPFTEISGVAPCASIRSYKVCPTSSCPSANVVAGIENAIADAVDVMNFSISGGTSPWTDSNRQFLDAVAANIFVAAASGNTNASIPNPVGRVNHRGPWVMSVAASTHDVPGSGLLSAAGPGTPPSNLQNIAAVGGSESPLAPELNDFPIRHFPDQDPGQEGCTPGQDGVPSGAPAFPGGYFDGAAALIQRGTCPFTTKINNAFDAGAELVIIRNNQSGALNMATPGQANVPAYSIGLLPGNALQNFVSANPETATIDFDPIAGDVLAGFSFRGPTPSPLQNLTKPDITAPGVSIYAAIPVGQGGYANISGTSMSSPHIAGAAALLRAVHPDWTPGAIQSAIRMTARRAGRKENLLDAWDWDDVGNGRVELGRAARAGLVMEESFANFLAADPATGGDVRTLNLPAVRDVNCMPECSWTRTVTSALDETAQWVVTVDAPTNFQVEVTPESFALDPGESRELTITASPVAGEPGTAIRFGAVNLATVEPGQSPDLHLTISVRGAGPEDRPVIHLHPQSLEVSLETTTTKQVGLSVANVGSSDVPLEWSVGAPAGGGCDGTLPAWISVTPESGSLPTAASQDLTVTVDAADLEAGNYAAELCFGSNDTIDPVVTVPVAVEVTELVLQADLGVSLVADTDYVAQGSLLGYTIEISNAGPRDAVNARIISSFDSGLADIQWTCIADITAVCNESGSGNLSEFFDLEAGATMTYLVYAVVADPGASDQITSSVLLIAPADLSDPNAGNNLDQVTVQSGVFRDNFE